VTSEFVDRIALVTGGTKATGRAIARYLGTRGARVVLNYFHDRLAAQQALDELRAQGVTVDAIRASIANPAEVRAMFQEIGERHGRLDILVNNAAYGVFRPFDELTERQWKRMFDTNFHGARLCAREALPLMRSAGGVIVNVSSTGSQFVIGNYAGVGPTKAALEALTRYLAVEYGAHGIRVNAASLSLLEGPSADRFPDGEQLRELFRRGSPLGRLAGLDDLARLVGFLASDNADWITGQVVVADGGLGTAFSAFSPQSYPPARGDARSDRSDCVPASSQTPADPTQIVAIVGMGAVVPDASGPAELWSLLCEDKPVFSLDRARFDPEVFGVRDDVCEDKSRVGFAGYLAGRQPDPQLRRELADGFLSTADETVAWIRQAARQALSSCSTGCNDRHHVYIGLAPEGSLQLEESLVIDGVMRRLSEVAAHSEALRCALSQAYPRAGAVRGALSYQLAREAFRGLLPSNPGVVVVDAACASGLYAIDLGAQAILSGQCTVALCGGAFAVSPRYQVLFDALHGLSPTAQVRAFDDAADGTLFSDGAALLALKRYDRAIADNDPVLGLIKGFGASSNGRGKAINASDVSGQRRAVDRAFGACGLQPADVDWVVAHATGTSAGDRAELQTLAESVPPETTWSVTSNKSLLGHTGPAAGAVSVVHALLGLAHSQIPAQRGYSTPPAAASCGCLDIPVAHKPWQHSVQRPRTAAVAGYGFGGANGFLLIEEPHPHGSGPLPPRREGQLVLVGWRARLPHDPDHASVVGWLAGGEASWPLTFSDHDVVDAARYRLPARAMRTIDRSHLIAMQCADDLVAELGGAFEPLRERAAVVLAMIGPTSANIDNALRCHLDSLGRAIDDTAVAAQFDAQALGRFVRQVRLDVPATNEDSLSGMMSNVAAGRVASHLDLHGPNARIEAGLDSVLAALHVSRHYLQSGSADAVLLMAINATSNTAVADAVHGDGQAATPIAQGAFGFALTLESVADERGLPILARFETVSPSPAPCTAAVGGDRRWLGATGAEELARAVVRGHPYELGARETGPSSPIRMIPATPVSKTDGFATSAAGLIRYVVRKQPRPGAVIRERLAAVPQDAVVLTNTEVLAADLVGVASGATVLVSSRCAAPPGATTISADHWSDDAAGALFSGTRHVRVVVDGRAPADDQLELHDLAFVVIQTLARHLDAGGSCALLVLGADAEPAGLSLAEMFAGFVRSLAAELPGCQTFGVLTDVTDTGQGLELLAAESQLDCSVPVVRQLRGVRLEDTWIPANAALVNTKLHLPNDPVILTVGGGRGVTAALTAALVNTVRPRLWVVGTTDIDSYPPELLDGTAPSRSEYLAAELRRAPDIPAAEQSRNYDRLLHAREAHRNIAAYRAVCGNERVSYRPCDVTCRDGVDAMVAQLLGREGRVDMVLQGAGINRSADLAHKSLSAFQSVRDVVVRGNLNLKAALGDRLPRVWCNVGSVVGLIGQPGETDYGSAHAFLAAVDRGRANARRREITIAWPHWRDVGFAATPLWRDRLARQAMFTSISTEQATAHFLAELAGDLDEHTIVLAGDAERRAATHGWRPDGERTARPPLIAIA
jgi:NAD(P)-dependent dehydrogenase (short-subunit alcohol dehydrogenase family)/3-oxoacyl-(acyl-carrier-protein) synthase